MGWGGVGGGVLGLGLWASPVSLEQNGVSLLLAKRGWDVPPYTSGPK